ncbi:protoheme IX farnesyltransferase 2 [Polycladomyces abyssicola]|uniref:Protoheme IX farnesyltransferase n=1 Tax=Polycladomyces abyssicola TaxID=1125966 RepID=A0A8D5UI84_9BACL|nr:heme o synthase [Polycladomyces abyssicola]BCU82941.1 protoheme IX farnesyltransferase 2 [Polycladomyces abyssicola]
MERPLTRETSVDPIMSSEAFTATPSRATWRDYLNITKPGINVSNLLAAFTGFWLAGPRSLDLTLLFFTLLGTALVIAGGCTLNNFIDRDIDPSMARTRNRPVAAGRIAPSTALWMGIVLTVAGISVLALGANPLAAVLGMIGFFVYVMVYTAWLKRTTTLNTVIGGISGAVPPMIGWTAVTGNVDLPAWILFLILFMWQPPHFLALAMRKVEDYRAAGVPMLPVVRGFMETKRQIMVYVAAMIPSSLFLYHTGVVGKIYFVTAIVLGVIYLVLSIAGFFTKDDDRWARQMFLYSLVYLTAILLVMIVDKVPPVAG